MDAFASTKWPGKTPRGTGILWVDGVRRIFSLGDRGEPVVHARDGVAQFRGVALRVGHVVTRLHHPGAAVEVDDQRRVVPLGNEQVELQVADVALGVGDSLVDADVARVLRTATVRFRSRPVRRRSIVP